MFVQVKRDITTLPLHCTARTWMEVNMCFVRQNCCKIEKDWNFFWLFLILLKTYVVSPCKQLYWETFRPELSNEIMGSLWYLVGEIFLTFWDKFIIILLIQWSRLYNKYLMFKSHFIQESSIKWFLNSFCCKYFPITKNEELSPDQIYLFKLTKRNERFKVVFWHRKILANSMS